MADRQLEESQAHAQIYREWEAAAKASRHAKAISREVITVKIPRGTFRVQIVKPLRGSPFAVYAYANGIAVHDWKVDHAKLARVQRWRPW